MKKPHISPSAVDMYLRCGEQYRRRYMLGERLPPGVALIKGSAVHRAAEINYRQKITTHADLSVRDMQEAAAEHVQATVKSDGLMLAPDEATRGASRIEGEIIDRAVALTTEFADRVAPTVMPILVEQFVTVELPNHTHNLVGRLDVADVADKIRDLKTSGRRKTQDEIDRSDQLTFYGIAFERLTGREPAGVVLDVLLDQKRTDVQRLESARTTKDKQVFLNRLNAVLVGVNRGNFPPAAPGSWTCSPRFCGYWWTCPYVNSERRAAAEMQET